MNKQTEQNIIEAELQIRIAACLERICCQSVAGELITELNALLKGCKLDLGLANIAFEQKAGLLESCEKALAERDDKIQAQADELNKLKAHVNTLRDALWDNTKSESIADGMCCDIAPHAVCDLLDRIPEQSLNHPIKSDS